MDITTVQNRIIEEMTRRGDWMDRYAYLTEQAKNMPEEYQQVRKDENAVSGCQSQVWVDADYRNGRLYFRADSDTVLTKGIIALILQVVDGRTPEEIVGTDLYVFRETGMESNLSPARSDGLNAIIRHIRMMARQYVTS
ncbi:MAG: SufE family protein [Bacteroidota bacterium]